MTEFTKTSRQRPFNVKTFNDNFDAIFKNKKLAIAEFEFDRHGNCTLEPNTVYVSPEVFHVKQKANHARR